MQCMQCVFTIFSNGRIFCPVLNFTMLFSVYMTSVNKFAPTMGFFGVTRSYSSCPFLCALDATHNAAGTQKY